MESAKLYTIKKQETDFPIVKISQPEDAVNYIRQFYHDDIEIYESFFILLLNRANETIGYAKISQGGITGTVVDTKIICKYVVDSLASGVILAHNHPSGNKQPSTQDIEVTKRLSNAIQILESQVLDHVILTKNDFYSFQENCLL